MLAAVSGADSPPDVAHCATPVTPPRRHLPSSSPRRFVTCVDPRHLRWCRVFARLLRRRRPPRRPSPASRGIAARLLRLTDLCRFRRDHTRGAGALPATSTGAGVSGCFWRHFFRGSAVQRGLALICATVLFALRRPNGRPSWSITPRGDALFNQGQTAPPLCCSLNLHCGCRLSDWARITRRCAGIFRRTPT